MHCVYGRSERLRCGLRLVVTGVPRVALEVFCNVMNIRVILGSGVGRKQGER